MTNTITAVTLVNARTFSDFDQTDVIEAVEASYTFCVGKKSSISTGGTLGNADFYQTNENDASVIADFASLILHNARKISKSKQSDQEFKTLVQLWAENPELETLLLVDQAVSEDYIEHEYLPPTMASRGGARWYDP